MIRAAVRRWRALRATLRVELRELRRRPRRSLLFLALVAVPVAAIVGGASILRVATPTDAERRAAAMGRADLKYDAPFEHAARAELDALLPPGSQVQTLVRTGERVSVPGRALRAGALALDPDGGADLAAGTFALLEGRVPENAGEAALSPLLLEGLGRGLGDRVALEYGAEREIVGVVADPESLDAPLVVRRAAAVEHAGRRETLVRLPDAGRDRAREVVEALRAAGAVATLRAEISGEGDELTWGLFVFGSIGFLEAGLVVAAAFLVGLRRRQYELGLVGAQGAPRAAVAGALVGSTAALALPGALLGALAGAGGAALATPFLDGWNRRLNGPFEIAWGPSLAAVGAGALVAVLAVALPALAAARMPVREALSGRRPVGTPSRVWLAAGAGAVALGLLLVVAAPREPALLGALATIAGSILGVLGFGVSSPFWLDAIGRRAGRLPLRWRLALRDAGRFRARNGPVVTAVLAGMAMSVTVAVLVASLESSLDALPARQRTDQLLVAGPEAERVARRLAALPGAAAAAPLEAAYAATEPVRARRDDDPFPSPARQWVAIGDEPLLRALGAEEGLAALRGGALIALQPPAGGLLERMGLASASSPAPAPGGADADAPRLTAWRDGGAIEPLPVAAVRVDQNALTPAWVVHPAVAERRGWRAGPPIDRSMSPWVVRFEAPVDDATIARAQAVAREAVGVTLEAPVSQGAPARGFARAVLALCVATGLVVVLVATALSSVESAADARVLEAVGAPPRLLRGLDAARAAWLAFLGCLLAIPAGLIPAIVLFEAARLPLEPTVPWIDLALALFALPALAGAAARFLRRPGPARGAAIVLLGVAALAPAATPATPATPEVRWEPHVGEAFDGAPLRGELGRVEVPADRARPGGPRLAIALVRYRTTHPDPGPPIVFLAGGPGGSGVALAGRTATHPQLRLLEHADVIGIDQRGVGLDRTAAAPLPLDRAAGRDEVVAALVRAAERVAADARADGLDPAWFDTREAADDVDAVRSALGLPQVVLYGASYGTHVALEVLRRHPDTVARAVLVRVEGPDHTWKLPETVQRRLAEVVPAGTVERLLARLDAGPAEAVAADGRPVVVGPLDLQRDLANALSEAATAAEIPTRLRAFERGDWSALAATALETRAAELSLMPWATDCASGGSPGRLAAIRRQALDPANLLGDAILLPHVPEACAPCAGCDLGADFRAPVAADVPVLFVSGALDVRTPPSNVEELLPGFPRGVHVVAENAGHASRELMAPEYRALLQGFLRGEPTVSARIALPPVPPVPPAPPAPPAPPVSAPAPPASARPPARPRRAAR